MFLWLFPIVVGGILISTAVHRQRRLAVLRRTPTTLVADLRAGPWDGGPAYEVRGTAQAGPDGPLRAPLSGVPCVWYRVKIVDRSRRRTGLHRRVRQYVADRSTEAPFVLEDGTGRVRVEVRKADILPGKPRLKRRVRADGGPGALAPDTISARVASGELSDTAPELRPDGEYRYEEWVLEEGAELYVQGPVRGTGDGLAIAGGDRVIGAGSERTVAGRLRRSILIGYTAGPVLIVLGLVILAWISVNTPSRIHP